MSLESNRVAYFIKDWIHAQAEGDPSMFGSYLDPDDPPWAFRVNGELNLIELALALEDDRVKRWNPMAVHPLPDETTQRALRAAFEADNHRGTFSDAEYESIHPRYKAYLEPIIEAVAGVILEPARDTP